MDFSLDQLQMFVQAARTGSFSAAARRLGKTQSTVSLAIANLKDDLKVELFDRSTRSPALTATGRKILLQAEAVLERCQDLQASADGLSQEPEPQLTLAIQAPCGPLLPLLREFEQAFPQVDLLLRQPHSSSASELVARGEAVLGLALSATGYPQALEFQQVGRLHLVHACRPDHPLAQRNPLSADDLQQHRRLCASSLPSQQPPSSEYLRCLRLWQVQDQHALLEMLRAGLGWAALPRQLVQRELARGELVELHLADPFHGDWQVGVDLLWARQSPLGQAGTWLKERLLHSRVYEMDRRGPPPAR